MGSKVNLGKIAPIPYQKVLELDQLASNAVSARHRLRVFASFTLTRLAD